MTHRINYRSSALIPRLSADTGGSAASGAPATLNEAARSVEVTAATEVPASVFDWDLGVVSEILLMDGVELPASGQVPLLDSHDRSEVKCVLGSFRGIAVRQGVSGPELTGTVFVSSDDSGLWDKIKEGHLTDFSVGYRQISSEWVPDGETHTIRGRSFQGPVLVTDRWRLRELSAVAIGADEMAKARADAAIPPNDQAKEIHMTDISTTGTPPEPAPPTDTQRGAVSPTSPVTAPAPAAVAGTAATATATATDDPDVQRMIADAIRRDRERTAEITGMCEIFRCEELAKGFLTSDISLDGVRKAIFDHVAQREAPQVGYAPARCIEDSRDKFRSAAQDSLILRAGMKLETVSVGADELRGMTLRELAKECLRTSGQRTHGDVREIVQRALASTDLPLIMANVANKSLFDGFTTANETWQEWCGTGSVNDFKTHSSMRISESDDLEQLAESEEYKYGQRLDSMEQYTIATYGKMFAVSRQAIINDDLGALTRIPAAHGEACARKIGDVAYAVLTANSAMGDGVALFDATNHGNQSAAGAPPSIDTITAAVLAMGTQKDLMKKRRLNIRPVFFIAPKALEGASEILFRSANYASPAVAGTVDNSYATTRINPYAGTYFTRVYDPRLDDVDNKTWYIATFRGKTVILYFLNGQQTPYMETQQGWEVDGLEYKVRIDVGAKAMDWRGLYKNAGH